MASSGDRRLTPGRRAFRPIEVHALYINDRSDEFPMHFLVVQTTSPDLKEGAIFAADTHIDYEYGDLEIDALHETAGAKVYKLRIRRLTETELESLDDGEIETYDFFLLAEPEVVGTKSTAEALRLMRVAGWPHRFSSD